MKRTRRANRTAIVALVFQCLAALSGLYVLRAVEADEWIRFAPEQSSSADSDPSQFLTHAFFARLMGVGSTPTQDAVADDVFDFRMAPSGPAQFRTAPHPPSRRKERSQFFFDEGDPSQQDITFLPTLPTRRRKEIVLRSGFWGVTRKGSLTKVGEYQDLQSSPFGDADVLLSDGVHTIDMFGSGLDNEGSAAGLYIFTPKYTADLQYLRFLHRLDHDPLSNIPPPSSGEEIVSEDLNVGEDYAVRVQDFRTTLRGRLTPDVKYRLKFWFRRKKGERQARGTQHGAPGDTGCTNCHVLSQRQQIDWTTFRIEPIIETRLGPVTAEYSRPMRSFSQSDAVVTRRYGGFHGYDYSGNFPYAVVPDTLSQTDRLKLGVNLPGATRIYALAHHGDTRNQVRDTRRRYYGFDVRAANTYSRQLALNAFARFNRQLNQTPPFLVQPEESALSVPTAVVPPYGLRQPIDYMRSTVGVDATWRPFRRYGLGRGLGFNIGAEHGLIKRSYADYAIENPSAVVDQDRTLFTSYFVGTTMKWHPRFDTFVRYRGRATSNPLYGVNMYSGATNTSLPEQEDVVQFGGTWAAADNLIASASVGIENRRNDSEIARFVEDNYPMTFTLWYAPNRAWSISGGYGYYSNWIDQDILFPSDDPATAPLDRRQWNYGGRGQVISLGSSYLWSDSLTLSAGLQYVWAFDAFDPLAPWPDLPAYSAVVVNRTRYTGGIDWSAHERISAYMRYIYESYDDGSYAYNSGSTHMLLGGLTGYY